MRRLCLLVAVCLVVPTAAASAETITFATLAPKQSPWGKTLSGWAFAVKRKSKGKLKIKIFYNGAHGDEGAVVRKMRSGQLDGAIVTSVGLSKIYKNILVLHAPGLARNWSQLDKVRNAMMPEFQKGIAAEGFHLLGAIDFGLQMTLSKGKGIRTPDDFKGMKVYRWSDDIIAPVTAMVMGYTGVPKSSLGLLAALQSGQINTITVPLLMATNMQWASELDHITAMPVAAGVGGIVVSKKALDGLPRGLRKILLTTANRASKQMTRRIRKADRRAYKQLSKRMTVVKVGTREKARWRSKFKKVRANLAQGVFDKHLITKAESLAGVK